MTRTLEVDIDESGNIRPVNPDERLPAGRAMLLLETGGHELYQMSELALADWLRPEEDEAWDHLQPGAPVAHKTHA